MQSLLIIDHFKVVNHIMLFVTSIFIQIKDMHFIKQSVGMKKQIISNKRDLVFLNSDTNKHQFTKNCNISAT